MGTRLKLPYPKELVPVSHADGSVITVLESNLQQLSRAGIDEAVIVIRAEKEIIRSYLGDFHHGVKLRYTYQQDRRTREGLPDALLTAQDLCSGYDLCIMLMGDVFFTDPNTVRYLTSMMHLASKAQVGLSMWETREPWRFGVVQVDGFRVTSVIDKPQHLTPPQKFWGACAFRRGFWPYLENEKDTFSAALHRAAQTLTVVECPTTGDYLDLGTPSSLIEGVIAINGVKKC